MTLVLHLFWQWLLVPLPTPPQLQVPKVNKVFGCKSMQANMCCPHIVHCRSAAVHTWNNATMAQCRLSMQAQIKQCNIAQCTQLQQCTMANASNHHHHNATAMHIQTPASMQPWSCINANATQQCPPPMPPPAHLSLAQSPDNFCHTISDHKVSKYDQKVSLSDFEGLAETDTL